METSMTWGDIMDAEDNALENVEFCFYDPWTTNTISQGEKQTAVEKTTKLLLRNLDYRIQDGRLYEEFLSFGHVISAKVVMENGRSNGTGFVMFSSPDEARRAIMEMNGRFLGRRPVYISPVQTKKENGTY